MQRMSLILSCAALIVALLGATPIGGAAGAVASNVVPLAKRSGYATNAGAVNGIKASRKPTAGKLVPLGPNGKLPKSIGAVGPTGEQGPPGVSGLQFIYGLGYSDGNDRAEARATCPEGKKLIGGGFVPSLHLPQGYVAMTESGPRPMASAWVVKAMEVVPYAGIWQIEAWAICAVVSS
jgi:hypothetical protein